jgi:hypothetical protein
MEERERERQRYKKMTPGAYKRWKRHILFVICAIEQVSVAAMLYTCILETLFGSDLGRDKASLTEVVRGYLQFLQPNAGILSRSILILLDLRFTRGL